MSRVHTAFIHFNEEEVRNLYRTPVTEDQISSRSLMKAFAITAAQARYLYGVSSINSQAVSVVLEYLLPEPLGMRRFCSDLKFFHAMK